MILTSSSMRLLPRSRLRAGYDTDQQTESWVYDTDQLVDEVVAEVKTESWV